MTADHSDAVDTLLRYRKRFVTHSQLSAPDLERPVINEDLFWGLARRWLEYGLSRNVSANQLLSKERVTTWPSALLSLLDEGAHLLGHTGQDSPAVLTAIRREVQGFSSAVATIRSLPPHLGSDEDATLAAAVREALAAVEAIRRHVTSFVLLIDDRIRLLMER